MAEDDDQIDLDKAVYTTFEIAEICHANITSVKNWIREDDDVEFHETPGGHKRLARDQLIAFLNKHDMPNPFLERRRKRLFALSADEALEERLRRQFGEVHRYETTSDPVYALLKIGCWHPDAVIVETAIPQFDAARFCHCRDRLVDLRPLEVVVVCNPEVDDEAELREAGADYVVDGAEGDEAIVDALQRILF